MSSAICFNLDWSKILLSGNGLTLYHTASTFNTLYKKPFENIAGKGENAPKQIFSTMFSTLPKTNFYF